ncbi:MAG: nucleotidyltransferase domain-containing protein [Spirochaetota bacterium]
MTIENEIGLIIKQLKENVERKYHIVDMKLFGSSARGDSSKSSDIDILIKLPIVNRSIEEDIFDIAYELELEHDCIIDVIVVPETVNINIPLYHNVEKEGIAI